MKITVVGVNFIDFFKIIFLFSSINLKKYINLKACSKDYWQCDCGTCVSRTKLCDGNIDCPEDTSDERHCNCEFMMFFNCL